MKDVFDLYEWNKKRYLGELNINKDIEGSSLNITRGGDNPKIGAELESDKNVVGENKEFLEDLADRLSSKISELRFIVNSSGDRIDVFGSQQDLANFSKKYQGQKYGEYEVFATDDDDRGEVVRIIKSKNLEEQIIDIDDQAQIMFGMDFNLLNPEEQELVRLQMDSAMLRESIKETLRFIKENNPEFTNEEIKAELKEIKMLGSLLDEKAKSKLCKRGRDYIAARKRAGEKSSAYLSGRGVKVCKGQIKFGGKKRKDFKGKK